MSTPVRPRKPRRSAVTGVVCAALVTIVVLASGAGGGRHENRRLKLPDLHGLLGWILGLAAVFAVVLLVASLSGVRRHRQFRRRSLLAQLLPLVLLVLFIFAWSLTVERNDQARRETLPDTGGEAGDRIDPRQVPPPAASTGEGLLVVLVLVCGAAVALFSVRRPSTPDDDDRTLTERISDVLDDVIDDLRLDPDPRLAVIRAYDRMEQTFAAHGMPRRESDAPLEFVARVLTHLDATEPSIMRLTALFERAMFSRHPVDRSMQLDAVDALVAIRDELRARSMASA